MALCTPGTPPGLNLCYCGRQGQAYPSRHTRRGAASLPRLMLAYQVHLMWNTKLLDLIWRWIQNFITPHEINKPYEFNWTKNKCLSYICHTETCDSELSFHESGQTVPAVNAISSDFLCMNFNVNILFFFHRNICQAKVFSVFCVCAHVLTCWC